MPFLVDSVSAELTHCELPIHLVIHPICKVRRSKAGSVIDILEMVIWMLRPVLRASCIFQIAQQPDAALRDIVKSLREVLEGVRSAVEDWRPMREHMEVVIDDLNHDPIGIQAEKTSEVRELLRWFHDNHFTFLGFREYEIPGSGKRQRLPSIKNRDLGCLEIQI
jgi:glutamate dehydrogenase